MPRSYSKLTIKDGNGEPLANGKIYFYRTGTYYPQDTYSDYALTSANTNPVILDSNGSASIRLQLNKSYRVVISDSNDKVLYTADEVFGGSTSPTLSSPLTDNLNVNGYTIGSTSNGNIVFAPAVTGDVKLTNFTPATNVDASSVNLVNCVITDANGKTALALSDTASAVNYITISNATTGNSPKIASSGSDTNIHLALRANNIGTTSSPNSGTRAIQISASGYSTSSNSDIPTITSADATYIESFTRLDTALGCAFHSATITVSGGTPTLARSAIFTAVVDSGVGNFGLTPRIEISQPAFLNTTLGTAACNAVGTVPLYAVAINDNAGDVTSLRVYSDLSVPTLADPTSVSLIYVAI